MLCSVFSAFSLGCRGIQIGCNFNTFSFLDNELILIVSTIQNFTQTTITRQHTYTYRRIDLQYNKCSIECLITVSPHIATRVQACWPAVCTFHLWSWEWRHEPVYRFRHWFPQSWQLASVRRLDCPLWQRQYSPIWKLLFGRFHFE